MIRFTLRVLHQKQKAELLGSAFLLRGMYGRHV